MNNKYSSGWLFLASNILVSVVLHQESHAFNGFQMTRRPLIQNILRNREHSFRSSKLFYGIYSYDPNEGLSRNDENDTTKTETVGIESKKAYDPDIFRQAKETVGASIESVQKTSDASMTQSIEIDTNRENKPTPNHQAKEVVGSSPIEVTGRNDASTTHSILGASNTDHDLEIIRQAKETVGASVEQIQNEQKPKKLDIEIPSREKDTILSSINPAQSVFNTEAMIKSKNALERHNLLSDTNAGMKEPLETAKVSGDKSDPTKNALNAIQNAEKVFSLLDKTAQTDEFPIALKEKLRSLHERNDVKRENRRQLNHRDDDDLVDRTDMLIQNLATGTINSNEFNTQLRKLQDQQHANDAAIGGTLLGIFGGTFFDILTHKLVETVQVFAPDFCYEYIHEPDSIQRIAIPFALATMLGGSFYTLYRGQTLHDEVQFENIESRKSMSEAELERYMINKRLETKEQHKNAVDVSATMLGLLIGVAVDMNFGNELYESNVPLIVPPLAISIICARSMYVICDGDSEASKFIRATLGVSTTNIFNAIGRILKENVSTTSETVAKTAEEVAKMPVKAVAEMKNSTANAIVNSVETKKKEVSLTVKKTVETVGNTVDEVVSIPTKKIDEAKFAIQNTQKKMQEELDKKIEEVAKKEQAYAKRQAEIAEMKKAAAEKKIAEENEKKMQAAEAKRQKIAAINEKKRLAEVAAASALKAQKEKKAQLELERKEIIESRKKRKLEQKLAIEAEKQQKFKLEEERKEAAKANQLEKARIETERRRAVIEEAEYRKLLAETKKEQERNARRQEAEEKRIQAETAAAERKLQVEARELKQQQAAAERKAKTDARKRRETEKRNKIESLQIGKSKAENLTPNWLRPKDVAIPKICDWSHGLDGSIYGKINGDPRYENGETIQTSPVHGRVKGGTVVETESGSKYFLEKNPSLTDLFDSRAEAEVEKEPKSLETTSSKESIDLFLSFGSMLGNAIKTDASKDEDTTKYVDAPMKLPFDFLGSSSENSENIETSKEEAVEIKPPFNIFPSRTTHLPPNQDQQKKVPENSKMHYTLMNAKGTLALEKKNKKAKGPIINPTQRKAAMVEREKRLAEMEARKEREELAKLARQQEEENRRASKPGSIMNRLIGRKGFPTLYKWKQSQNGSIVGIISGSPSFEEGDLVETNPVSTRAVGGEIVQTYSGERYYLADYREHGESPPKKGKVKTKAPPGVPSLMHWKKK